MRPLVAHCHLGLGKLYRHTGKREQAQEHLTTTVPLADPWEAAPPPGAHPSWDVTLRVSDLDALEEDQIQNRPITLTTA